MRVITGVMALLMSFCLVLSAQDSSIKEGDKRYTPTRLEWLATDLNSRLGVSLTESGFQMEFIPLSGKDTILIYVSYLPNVDRVAMNVNIETAKKVIDIEAKSYGWSSWLKVKEQFEMGKEHPDK